MEEEGDAGALGGEAGGGAGPGAGTVDGVVDAVSDAGEGDFGVGRHFPDGGFEGGEGTALGLDVLNV